MNSDAIDAFRVFSNHLNFTHAAKELCISQPALHVKISKLAESLGAELYTKAGRNLVLTAEGIRLQQFALDAHHRSEAFFDGFSRSGDQPISLSAGAGAYLYLLGGAIDAFHRLNLAKLQLNTADSRQSVESVMRGEAHIGVAVLSEPPRHLKHRPLASVPLSLVVPKSHPLARRKSLKLADCVGERLVLPARGRPLREQVERHCSTLGISCEVAAEATGWDLIIHFVALGVGVGMVNSCVKIPRTLRAIPIQGLDPVNYSVIWRDDAWLSQAALKLKALIIQHRNDWKAA